jgi:glycolate oxidase FAD binding subunit
MDTALALIQERVTAAAAEQRPLALIGSGSKRFCTDSVVGEELSLVGFRGIVDYEPSELVLVARAGTPLEELEATLAAHAQMLPFEPPHYGGGGTLGGAVASGSSGPRRAYAGAARDFLLGVRLLDGRGQELQFGGRVIKNVAGYDVARLMAGACGTLGILLELAIKVQPRPQAEQSLRFEMTEQRAIETLNRWAGQPLPLTASSYHRGVLSVRLGGAAAGVAAARRALGGEEVAQGAAHWQALRDQTAKFFRGDGPLWRVSVPATTAPLALGTDVLIEWGGALRWVPGELDAGNLEALLVRAGGHARLYRGPGSRAPVPSLSPALQRIHRALKTNFDPEAILNRGLALGA